MPLKVKEYEIIRQCTNRDCPNCNSNIAILSTPQNITLSNVIEESRTCAMCYDGMVRVKRATFKLIDK